MGLNLHINIFCRLQSDIPNKSQPDKVGQASPAFRCIGEPYNKDVEECKMFDFIIEMIVDIEEMRGFLLPCAEDLQLFGKTVLKNKRLLPAALSADVTYARTVLFPKMFVRTGHTAI